MIGEISINTLLADYGNLRYHMGKHIAEPIKDYEKMLIVLGDKYGIEYDYKDDVEFYSGEDPIDKTYYLECRLLHHLSELILKLGEIGMKKISCKDCIACKQKDEDYNYCEYYNDYFEKEGNHNICLKYIGDDYEWIK